MLLHLSDLHFGTEQLSRIEAIKQFCKIHRPELVVVSGDLTQRAKFIEFFKCRQFLEGLNIPYLVVPGNHDIPLYHVWRRFINPFSRYQLFFGATEKILETEHFYVIGVNSIRPRYHTKGYLSSRQILDVSLKLEAAPAHKIKLIAVHQPFYCEPFDRHVKDCPVLGEIALRQWSNLGLMGLLHGHLHQSALYNLHDFYQLNCTQAVLDIHAGSALSSRLHHGEQNGFNVIDLNGQISAYLFDPERQSFDCARRLWPVID